MRGNSHKLPKTSRGVCGREGKQLYRASHPSRTPGTGAVSLRELPGSGPSMQIAWKHGLTETALPLTKINARWLMQRLERALSR